MNNETIVLEIKLPVAIQELAAVTDALGRLHGKDTLFMRQVGPMLQLYKPRIPATQRDAVGFEVLKIEPCPPT